MAVSPEYGRYRAVQRIIRYLACSSFPLHRFTPLVFPRRAAGGRTDHLPTLVRSAKELCVAAPINSAILRRKNRFAARLLAFLNSCRRCRRLTVPS